MTDPTGVSAATCTTSASVTSGVSAATGLGGMSAALLLIVDSRLPAGGHAHSGGAEEAVHIGAVTGPEDLSRFLRGRLATTGLVSAALSAAACHLAATPPAEHRWRELDGEADARTPSPAMRVASRTQGRLLVRSARRIWPSPTLDEVAAALPDGAHHAVALGAVAFAAGCPPAEAALAAAYNTITGPATAAVRLLGLDPVVVHRLLAELAPRLDDTVRDAVSALDAVCAGTGTSNPSSESGSGRNASFRHPPHAERAQPRGDRPQRHNGTNQYDWAALPSCGAPALDLLAEGHLRREVRLFVS